MASAGPERHAQETGFLSDLRRLAATSPNAAALIEPRGANYTFASLQDRMAAIAQAVQRAGIMRGDVVALVLAEGADLMASFLGIASVAGCAVLNPTLRSSEMEAVLDQLGARAVLTDPRLGSTAKDAAAALGIAVLETATEKGVAGHGTVETPVERDVALLLHTSATTGKARIVPLTHSNLRAMADNTCGILNLSSADRMLCMMPMFHLQGLLSSLSQLLAGGSVICTAGFDAGAFLGWLEEYRPTWYTAGPALHQSILALVEAHPKILDRARLRFVRSIGARLPEELLQQLESVLGVPVLEGYGTTEAGAVTSNTPQRRKTASAGRSTGPEIAILGEDGEFLPPGCEGEIVVRGAAVMHAYHNDPDANRNAFHAGWFRTGDLGRLDGEGFLFVTGRIKEIINRGGEKILPAEIEDALMAHPAVAEAVAFGVAHPRLGEDVLAAVVVRAGASVSEPELRRFAGQRIADFKLPRRIVIVSAIPKGATGKPSRAVLAEQLRAQLDAMPETPEAETEVEKSIAAIWRRVLQVESAGTQDDFFQLGGDSLALTLMLAELEWELGPEERAEFLSSPTIETLARIVTRPQAERAGKSSVVALQRQGLRIPFFCIPGANEDPYYFVELAKRLGEDQPFFIVRDPRPPQARGVYTLEEHAARFAQAIRSMRAEGPYLLGGHCYGGVVAFEVARQLQAEAQEVGLVALFEVPAPGYPKVVRHWKQYVKHSAALVASVARGRTELVSAAWSHAGALRRVFGRKRQAVTRRVLVAAGLKNMIEPMEALEIRNERAGRAYLPGRLECPVVSFVAADEPHSTVILEDPRLCWRDMVGSGFTACEVPGIGDAIFQPPNVDQLASQLRELLDAASVRSAMPNTRAFGSPTRG